MLLAETIDGYHVWQTCQGSAGHQAAVVVPQTLQYKLVAFMPPPHTHKHTQLNSVTL